jgi:hypothetical protein
MAASLTVYADRGSISEVGSKDLTEINRFRDLVCEEIFSILIISEREKTMKIKLPMLIAISAASWVAFWGPALATDLNGSWATDAAVCAKVFVKNGGTISFVRDSDQYGGGFIVEGNKVRGQLQTCIIKARKEDGNTINFIAACASDIMASNIQFSARVIDDNTIIRIFPGMGDELAMKYSRCPN